MSFEYNDKKIEGRIRISPSGMYNYYDNPSKWYKSNVLGQKMSINSQMVIGTLIHHRLEEFYNGRVHNLDDEVEYLSRFKDTPEIDDWEVIETVDKTWEYLYDEFIPTMQKPDSFEEFIEYIPATNPDIWVGGSYDYLRGNTVGDYKTANSIAKEIKTHHRVQLYIYAWILNQSGHSIDSIECVYIQKWTKGKPNPKYDGSTKYKEFLGSKDAQAVIVKEEIDPEFMNVVLQDMKNIGTMISMCKQDESLVPLFFRTNLLSHFS